MSREEQIEKTAMTPLDVLANDIYQHCPDLAENYCGDTHCVACMANGLYNAQYRKQEWTNIAEDGFPKEEGEYFVWNAEQRKREIRFFFRLPPNLPVETNPEVREYFGNSADHKKITHWMPLPEPPIEKYTEGET